MTDDEIADRSDDETNGRSDDSDRRSDHDPRSSAESGQHADPLDWSAPDHSDSVAGSDRAGEPGSDADRSGSDADGFGRGADRFAPTDSRFGRAGDAAGGEDRAVPSSDDVDSSHGANRESDGLTPDAVDPSADDSAGAPLGDLATSVRERQDGQREPVDEGLFEEQDVASIDTDVVWDQLEDEATGDDTATAGREERVVEKGSYCERCPFFSAPPDVACGHDGTSIVELVDVDHFRVADCPKVEETERLERL